MSRWQACVTVLCLSLALSWSLVDVHAANRALEIMREVDRRQWSESRSNEGAIEVIDSGGKILHKNWQFWAQGHSGESKSLIRFTAPAEVRGVGFLTLNRSTGSAEQWLYTPAIQRDRRIAPQEKSSRFIGTDFTNEDMEERSIENYDYDLLAEEDFEGQPAYKIKAVYKDRENTSYSHQILWVRKDIMATTSTEFYRGSTLAKTLRWSDWQEIQGIWTPLAVEMKDLTRGSATRIHISNVQYNLAFPDEWFSLRNLRRGL